MAETDVREDILDIVKAVANVGNVYDYERWAAFVDGIEELIGTYIDGSRVIRFWTITCEQVEQEYTRFGDGRDGITRRYTYKIRGWFGLDDANESEKAAIAVVEDVLEALDNSGTLHGGQTYVYADPAQLDRFGWDFAGDEMCHYAEITQRVQEEQ